MDGAFSFTIISSFCTLWNYSALLYYGCKEKIRVQSFERWSNSRKAPNELSTCPENCIVHRTIYELNFHMQSYSLFFRKMKILFSLESFKTFAQFEF